MMIKPVFVYYTPTEIIVVLSKAFDLTYVSTRWMDDPRYPEDECLRPELDLTETEFSFSRDAEGEIAAFKKVAELYSEQLKDQ